jgi:hypothetical protein
MLESNRLARPPGFSAFTISSLDPLVALRTDM